MNSAFFAVPLAAFLVAILSPVAMRLAVRFGAVSVPGGRHVHDREIPRLGGLAIAAAFFVTIALLAVFSRGVAGVLGARPGLLVALCGGGLAMCAVGVIDDTRGLRATHKLAAQVGVALMAFSCGFRVEALHLPFVGDVALGYLGLPISLIWIVGVMNAVNLIDGLDGLAAGVVLFAAGVNLFVAFHSQAGFEAMLSGATAGVALGFLFHNFNPARIFMGDSGSYFLGYVLAVTGLMAQKGSTAVSLLVPMVALGVPIVDTLFAMVRRILERRPVFSPDRGHIHHRLLDMGITHRRAVLIIYGVCVGCTVLAVGMWVERSIEFAGAIVAALIVIVGLVRFGGAVGTSLNRNRQRERFRSRDAEVMRRALPRVPSSFDAARSEDELFEALTAFAKAAELAKVEASPLEGERDAEPIFRWVSAPDSSKRGLVWARYPVGGDSVARMRLSFAWVSDSLEVSPQCDILLQVASDVFATGLSRLGSRLAPHAPGAEEAETRVDAFSLGENPKAPLEASSVLDAAR